MTPAGTCHSEHAVGFYATDGFLCDALSDYAGAALLEGGSAIVLATRSHRTQLERALADLGIDVRGSADEGRYVALDAAELLASIMADGSLSRAQFRDAIVPLLERAADRAAPVRVYGELVALLLAAGDEPSTLALEDLWNELSETHSFELLCGYPAQAFEGHGTETVEHVCDRHRAIVRPESYALLTGVPDQARMARELRGEMAVLRSELDQLRARQQDLVALAYDDALTGLANRRAFDEQLAREWALAAREGDSFVLIADLDGFKEVNDTFGHAAGDHVLRGFAEVLRQSARSTDVVARLGGDEFGVLLVRCDERAAYDLRQRMRAALEHHADPHLRSQRVSVGHASLRQATSPAQAYDRADLAMLATKRSNRRRPRSPSSSR